MEECRLTQSLILITNNHPIPINMCKEIETFHHHTITSRIPSTI